MAKKKASTRTTGGKKTTRKTYPKGVCDTAAPMEAVLTVGDLVTYLNFPKSTIHKLAQEGEIPGHKVGRHWRFHKNVNDRWLGDDGSDRGIVK